MQFQLEFFLSTFFFSCTCSLFFCVFTSRDLSLFNLSLTAITWQPASFFIKLMIMKVVLVDLYKSTKKTAAATVAERQ